MTLVRGLALRISDAVVRWASPGCKEWAEGLAREVEFIEGDWAALRWAIGSARVLLDRRVTPIGARRDGPAAMPGWWVWPFMVASQIFTSCISAFRASSWEDRIGWGLLAIGWLYMGTSSVLNWLEDRKAPPISDIQAYWLFSRAKLERRLGRYRSVRRWFPVLATVSFCTGSVLTLKGGSLWGHIFTGLVIAGGAFAIWMQCLESPDKIEQRLALMDERIVKPTGVGMTTPRCTPEFSRLMGKIRMKRKERL
jgi:hypothetical protein